MCSFINLSAVLIFVFCPTHVFLFMFPFVSSQSLQSFGQIDILITFHLPVFQVVHVSGAEVLQKKLPNLHHADLIPCCGHAINMDQPRHFAKVVSQFWMELQNKQDWQHKYLIDSFVFSPAPAMTKVPFSRFSLPFSSVTLTQPLKEIHRHHAKVLFCFCTIPHIYIYIYFLVLKDSTEMLKLRLCIFFIICSLWLLKFTALFACSRDVQIIIKTKTLSDKFIWWHSLRDFKKGRSISCFPINCHFLCECECSSG